MSQYLNDLFPVLSHDFVLPFLAELMNQTQTATTPEAFQHAVQTYCDELRPWVLPGDVPPTPRAVFSLYEECTIREDTDEILVRFSPEGAAFFRAWLRRQGVMEATAQAKGDGWSH
jgi:hypothetical protein